MLLPGRKKRLLTAAAVLAALLLCGCTPKLEFSAGKVEREAAEISIVLKERETALLNEMPNLKKAELSGSLCYGEIMAWAEAHPDVDVSYTVTMPEGSVVPHDAESLDLSKLKTEDIDEAAALLEYLPQLEELILQPGEFSASGIKALCGAGKLKTEYSFYIAGQELDYYAKEVDLSTMTAEELPLAIELLGNMPELKLVELGSADTGSLSWVELTRLMDACPELKYEYDFFLYGVPVSLSDRKIDLSYIPIYDAGAELLSAAGYMKHLAYVDMDSCGLSNENMEYLRALMPDVLLVWRVYFGDNYSVRTDTERILASKPSAGGFVTDRDGAVLKYCTEVKYLDLGHNEFITDISFMANMTKLEVVVLAMNRITDISPLANCPKLEYLEIQTNEGISDLSPLANCPELAHLNVGRCRNISDISPLFGLKKLERFWLGSGNRVPYEQVEQLRALLPDCVVETSIWNDPTASGWRYTGTDPKVLWTSVPILHERYELLCEQFGYTDKDYSFPQNDPKYRG